MKPSLVALTLLLFCSAACNKPPALPPEPRVTVDSSILSQAGRDWMSAVRAMDNRATEEAFREDIGSLLSLMPRVAFADMDSVRLGLALLRAIPFSAPAIADHYRSLARDDFAGRLLALRVLGELQDLRSLSLFVAVAWEELPRPSNAAEGRSLRASEESVQRAAVVGLAFIRTEDGLHAEDASLEVLRVIREHPSRSVRVAAADAYLWNNDDSPAALARVSETIAPELLPYVTQTRFYRGADAEVFSSRVSEWRRKWPRN